MKEVSENIVKAGVDKALKDLTEHLQKLGFKHTKKWWWVRLKSNSADFIHLHKSGSSYRGSSINYSVSFRVHCGNRELNDPKDWLVLNGPDSDMPETYEGKYHFRLNTKSGSTYDRCINDLVRYVKEFGEPWFLSVKEPNPTQEEIKKENIKQSYKLLGVRGIKL